MNHESATAATPLAGIRVLDLTRVLAGPFATMILADLGAEVVKIERPPSGDDARAFGPFLPSGTSAYFASLNRGKKSVLLDLKGAADRATFLQLVERADVVVENFRPGAMDSLGLGVETLRQRHPRLIYTSVSGFGRDGPHASRPAYDIVIQATSGLMSITGESQSSSVRVGTSISNLLAGLYAVIGILATLRRRDVTGTAADLDLAMLDCSVAALENAISRADVTGIIPEPLGTRHPSITPFQAFATSDRPLVVAAGNDALWQKLCAVLGCRELVRDPRFASNELRTVNHSELERLLAECFARDPCAAWLAKLDSAGVPAAPVRNIVEVIADPDLRARGMLHTMHDVDGAKILTAGSPLRFDGRELELSSHAPALGEHTEEVFRDWLGSRRHA